MTVSYVSSSSAETTLISMPSHQAGDLLVMFAFNNGSTTVPTVPSGWVTVATRSANSRGSVLAFRIASSGSETSGTWTNATFVAVGVWRDTDNYLTIGQYIQNGNSSNVNVNYAVVVGRTTTSWYAGFGGASLNSQSLETPPSGMTNRTNTAGASSGEVVIHDTNGLVVSWSQTATVVGSAVAYHTYVAEIVDTGIAISSGGSAGVQTARSMTGGMAA